MTRNFLAVENIVANAWASSLDPVVFSSPSSLFAFLFSILLLPVVGPAPINVSESDSIPGSLLSNASKEPKAYPNPARPMISSVARDRWDRTSIRGGFDGVDADGLIGTCVSAVRSHMSRS